MLEVSQVLYVVAGSLDARRSIADVAGTVSARLGRRISPESVAYLIDTKLRPLGLISVGGSPPVLVASPPPVLSLTLRAGVIPSGAVRRMTSALRPLFLPPVVAGALVGLVALDAWLALHAHLGSVVGRVADRPASLVVVVLLTLVAGGFHELGHATASRYGGAEPGRIGVGVYLLWPVFFNDLNDSYRLSRRGRLRADLGGIYFNVVFMLALAAIYAVTGFTPLLLVVVAQHLAVAQQFLPFVRLDGYYLVCDLAGVPDLFGRIRPILASVFSWCPTTRAVSELTPASRAVVVAWVWVSVPLLGACVVFSVVQAPELLTALARSLIVETRRFAAAVGHAAPAEAFLSGIQVVFLALPLVGLILTLLRSVRRKRAATRRGRPGADGKVE